MALALTKKDLESSCGSRRLGIEEKRRRRERHHLYAVFCSKTVREDEGLDKGAAKDEEWNAFTVLIGALATNQIFHCLESVRRNRHLGFL